MWGWLNAVRPFGYGTSHPLFDRSAVCVKHNRRSIKCNSGSSLSGCSGSCGSCSACLLAVVAVLVVVVVVVVAGLGKAW